MKKKIGILGSTGSIGTTTLNIIQNNRKDFNVDFLSTNKNIKKLLNQAVKFKVKNLIIHDKDIFFRYQSILKSKGYNVFNNVNDLTKKNKTRFYYIMSSITGLDGLEPTLDIIKHTKNIAIANKEAIICGWNLIKKKLKNYNTQFIPVDSEHFSISELIKKENIYNIKKIFITASGGPFLKIKKDSIKKSNSLKATKHPTWKMGKKISVDSSTLMNKVFELIEAKKIFNLKNNFFEIIVQPTSYVHGIVEFKNGVTKLLTHPTSMRVPIFNSIYYNQKKNINLENIDFNKLNKLNFQKIDYDKFPINRIIKRLNNKDSLFETVLITANDTLVNLYLKNKIKFYDIYKILIKILNLRVFKRLNQTTPKNLEQIKQLSRKVRLKTQSLSVRS